MIVTCSVRDHVSGQQTAFKTCFSDLRLRKVPPLLEDFLSPCKRGGSWADPLSKPHPQNLIVGKVRLVGTRLYTHRRSRPTCEGINGCQEKLGFVRRRSRVSNHQPPVYQTTPTTVVNTRRFPLTRLAPHHLAGRCHISAETLATYAVQT